MNWNVSLALYLVACIFWPVFIGVVLPAVWSAKPSRRHAALEVLTKLLTALTRERRQR